MRLFLGTEAWGAIATLSDNTVAKRRLYRKTSNGHFRYIKKYCARVAIAVLFIARLWLGGYRP